VTTRQREPRREDPKYLKWIRLQPCVQCAWEGRAVFGCEAAHVKIGISEHGWREHGGGERSHDDHAVSLCPSCHRTGKNAQHRTGERKFWLRLGMCPACLCTSLRSCYEAGEPGVSAIWDAVHAAKQAPTDHI
jgi:hypothetical protein